MTDVGDRVDDARTSDNEHPSALEKDGVPEEIDPRSFTEKEDERNEERNDERNDDEAAIVVDDKARRREEGRRRAREIAEQRRRRRRDEDPSTPPPRSGRHGARNQNRHQRLTRWLARTFPRALRDEEERHVLDVAGGRGELAARLALCLRVRVVTVDPRPADVRGCFEDRVLKTLPEKWQKRWRTRPEEERAAHLEARFGQIVGPFSWPPPPTDDGDALRRAVDGASLLVGMHADGATEAVVDAALERGVPFVVVPCCVFPNLFRRRRTADGAPVRTHAQFCKYLTEKDPRLVAETLPFAGRNVAVWWDGTSTTTTEGNQTRPPSSLVCVEPPSSELGPSRSESRHKV